MFSKLFVVSMAIISTSAFANSQSTNNGSSDIFNDNLRSIIKKLTGNPYKELGKFIVSELSGKSFQGIQQHDGKPCSVDFIVQADKSVQIEFSYTPAIEVKPGEEFGNEIFSGEEFEGNLGLPQIYRHKGFVFGEQAHLIGYTENGGNFEISSYAVTRGFKDAVICKAD
jgi:hypothetical protein